MTRDKAVIYGKAAVEAILIAWVIFCVFYDWNSVNSYVQYNTSSLHYEKGTVESVKSEELQPADEDETLRLGKQSLLVKITSGSYKGETVEIINYLTRGHIVEASAGIKLIICVDEPENADVFYSVYNYDRTARIVVVFSIFAVIMVLIGRRKGVYALGSLLFSGGAIVAYTAQAAYHGGAPLTISLLTVISISLFTFILICDNNRKLTISVLSTALGIAVAILAYKVFSSILHITGYNSDDVDSLTMIAQATGMSVRGLLLIPVSITALGAIMDITLSLASALDELRTQNAVVGRQQIIRSGMNIGKDMIGTMSNTLILAILGENFVLLLLLISYGYQTKQLLSSDIVGVQLAQSVAATIGVIVSVPIAALISAFFLSPRRTAGKKTRRR